MPLAAASPSFGDVATGGRLDVAAIVVLTLASVAYLRAARRLGARGRAWPRARTGAWLGAVAAGALATLSGIGEYDTESLPVHMVQHALLAMVVPLLAVLAAPVTLALQAGGPATKRILRAALRSRAGRALGHPVVGFALFGGGLVAIYLTPLLEEAASNGLVHAAVHAHLVTSGWLFLAPVVAVDALPRPVPHGLRLVAILAAVPFHAFLGIVLVTADEPLAPDAYPSVSAQHDAGGILWAAGELLSLALVAVVVVRWAAEDRREAARSDRRDALR